jgi:hypothetical protein
MREDLRFRYDVNHDGIVTDCEIFEYEMAIEAYNRET